MILSRIPTESMLSSAFRLFQQWNTYIEKMIENDGERIDRVYILRQACVIISRKIQSVEKKCLKVVRIILYYHTAFVTIQMVPGTMIRLKDDHRRVLGIGFLQDFIHHCLSNLD